MQWRPRWPRWSSRRPSAPRPSMKNRGGRCSRSSRSRSLLLLLSTWEGKTSSSLQSSSCTRGGDWEQTDPFPDLSLWSKSPDHIITENVTWVISCNLYDLSTNDPIHFMQSLLKTKLMTGLSYLGPGPQKWYANCREEVKLKHNVLSNKFHQILRKDFWNIDLSTVTF